MAGLAQRVHDFTLSLILVLSFSDLQTCFKHFIGALSDQLHLATVFDRHVEACTINTRGSRM